MKKTLPLQKLLFSLSIFGLLCLAACKKDNYSLPPETQNGANTFGCKIDGKVWVPKGTDYNSGQNVTAYYQHIYSGQEGFVFRVSATNYEKKPLEYFSIVLDSSKIQTGISYTIRNGYKGEFYAAYWIGSSQAKSFYVKEPLKGSIVFHKFDENNKIASGLFEFDAVNSYGELIHVTEGRFDVKFTR